LLNLRSATHMLKVLFVKPGILSKVLAGVFPYFSPTFHPWDDDNREIIRIWKRAHEQTGDTRKAFEALLKHQRGTRTGRRLRPVAQPA
ncbi:MAG: metal-dependent hydrolase, partial [Alcanivoracaceae bacterium]|nr:metal-dependent hydrolase [Alcanivoracaceae bacterium]